jgi:hypothetical protein
VLYPQGAKEWELYPLTPVFRQTVYGTLKKLVSASGVEEGPLRKVIYPSETSWRERHTLSS